MSRTLCFPLQRLPSRETVLPECNLLGFYQILTDLGKGRYPTPAPLAFSVEQRKQPSLTKRLSLIIGSQNASPTPHLTTTTLGLLCNHRGLKVKELQALVPDMSLMSLQANPKTGRKAKTRTVEEISAVTLQQQTVNKA